MKRFIYILNMALLGTSSVALIPALVSTMTVRGWAEVAVGQAIGGFFGVVVGLGWGITGPARVANLSAGAAVSEYSFSLRLRLAMFIFCAPAIAAIVGLLSSNAPAEAITAAISMALVGAGAGWYFIGRNQAKNWLILETIPRTSFNLMAVAAATLGTAAIIVLVISAFGVLSGIILSSWFIRRGRDTDSVALPEARSILEGLRGQAPATFAGLMGAVYGAAPIVLISLIAPGVTSTFAVIDKLHKQVASAVSPAVQISQQYVSYGSSESWILRAVKSAKFISLISLFLYVTYVALVAWIVSVLTIGAVHLSPFVAALSALLVTLMFVEQYIGRALLPSLGIVRSLAVATSVGSAAGLVLLTLLSATFGASGALLALCFGYLIAIGIEVLAVVKSRRAF